MATQLTFTLRTSPNCKTVHLLGSWDNYSGQLPLTKDAAGKPGSWKGHFRFQPTTLKPGQRYWYYYIMNNSMVSHDPAKPSVQEKTTGRTLNVLDVPKAAKGLQVKVPATKKGISAANSPISPLAVTVPIATGRPVSPSRIAHPKPSKPYASRAVREADYDENPIENLEGKLEQLELYEHNFDVPSPTSSVASSDLSSSSGFSTPSSASSLSDASSVCHCNRYGVTRAGKKVLLDCGGSRCGYSDDSSSCSSEDESEIEDSGDERAVSRPVQKKVVQAAATRGRATTTASRRR